MKRRKLTWALTLIAAALLALGTGCGDDKVIAIGGGHDTRSDTLVTLPDGATPHPSGREIIVLHDTSAPKQVTVTQNELIQVKVLDYGLGGPAVDVGVNFEIIAGDDRGDASLTSLQAYTDATGVAAITFRSGTTADVTYTIEVRTSRADPVRFDLYVTDSPRGDLRVALQYEGPVSVKNVQIKLMDGNYTCPQFNPVRPPTDAIAEKTLLGVGEDVVWKNLAEERFTIVATAESQRGTLAAAGCLDGVVVIGEQENKVTMTMFLLVMNPTGVYDSSSIFDFTGAIPGRVGDVLDEIALLFTSPGTFLINQVKKLAALYVGELITDLVFGLFEDKVAEVIDDWMLNRSPDWLQDIFIIGRDLTQVINNLEMLADLHISKLQNDYYVQGALRWNGLVLKWRYGCPPESDPGHDACARYEFSLADFQNTQFPMDIIEGKFTASIRDFDQLDIDNHTIKLNYGKLIIFVLNEMILPAISDEHTLKDAIISFVNCRSIAENIGGGFLNSLGISVDDIEGFCVDAITLIVSPVEILLSNLALDSQLRMKGHATLIDDDSDLRVDEIIDGNFLGNFESDGQEGSPFTGTWQAIKKPQP